MEKKLVEFDKTERRLMVCSGIGKTLIHQVECRGASKDTAVRMFKVIGRPLLELLYGDADIEAKILAGMLPKRARGRPRKEEESKNKHPKVG